MEREKLQSRLGFILLSAGCAIGCGNVWKFPYLCGANGGGAFVLIYLICLLILGLPVMTVEFALGRASQKSPARMYQALEPKGTKWHIHGKFAVAGNIFLMMFYTSVAGWILYYFFKSATGTFVGMNTSSVNAVFSNLTSSPLLMVSVMAVVVILGFVILSFGLQKGLEKVSKYMMLSLFVLMLVLVVHGMTLSGAKDAIAFYLKPDFSKITASVVVSAMNQAFFTLSIGIGSMAIFGSYIGKDHSLMGESFNVIVLDTLVAIIAGLIIFPACFTYGIDPGAGPSLLFIAMANVFANMPGGAIWGSLFFLFMFFAAMSTVLAVCENIIACVMDMTSWSRKKACLICGIAVLVLATPCALGFNVLSGFEPLGEGTGVLDLEDFLVSNILLPLGSVLFVIFCTVKSKRTWGWDAFKAEANEGKGLKVKDWMKPYFTYVIPAVTLVVFFVGISTFKDKISLAIVVGFVAFALGVFVTARDKD